MNNRTRMKYKACDKGMRGELRNHFNSPSRYIAAMGEWGVRFFRIGFDSVRRAKISYARICKV